MSDSIVVDAGEYTATELLEQLRDGDRLVVQTEVLGSPEELTLRYDGTTYYCDTPTTLHKHGTEDEMEQCMRHYGYVKDV